MGYNFVADIGLRVIRLAVIACQICESPREFEIIAGHGHSRSSILMSIESAYTTSY